ncbi:MAG: MMPL family transporter [Chloroflexi bacterium]|nr:MMPL family transporter [Chloroflexota bacterium]
MGVQVVGIGTEFMVLILGRYQEEGKVGGKQPKAAMVTAISTTGQDMATTALATLGGFGVLISSYFVLIRDFGVATTIAVFLCLLSSMIVMPPLIVWWDRHVALRLPSWHFRLCHSLKCQSNYHVIARKRYRR